MHEVFLATDAGRVHGGCPAAQVCNLCKTWSIQKLKKTPTQGQQMSQGPPSPLPFCPRSRRVVEMHLRPCSPTTVELGKDEERREMPAAEHARPSINLDPKHCLPRMKLITISRDFRDRSDPKSGLACFNQSILTANLSGPFFDCIEGDSTSP